MRRPGVPCHTQTAADPEASAQVAPADGPEGAAVGPQRARFSGGCACGAVRYAGTADPVAMFNCHCTDCQRVSGGSFVAVALMAAPALQLTRGEPRYHRTIGASGRWTDRGFCAACGTPLFARGEVAPGHIAVRPGSLDDPSWFRPTIDTWAGHAPAWLMQDPALPKAAGTPNVIRGPRSQRPGAADTPDRAGG